ncbi:MAG: glutamate-1-semialdehyde 2,1-aminomutase [Elusimicrobia bacterium]|nr:glutamate-1-semialdehyde 2,1-aminomutase [Elusimicrobiota bacterium]
MRKSRAWFKRASGVLVGGVNSPVRAFKAVGGSPVFIHSGRGSKFKDVDGKTYIDFCLSWGPLILGHSHPAVLSAARRAAEKGTTFGASTPNETLLAERIRAALPSMELLRLTSSGTEAVMSALRLARAATGRDLAVKFAGCYHGHVDSLLVAAGSGALTLGAPDSAGVPKTWAGTTLSLPYNDLDAVAKAFAKHGKRIAAVIVEPVAANMGVVLPQAGFLTGLREITRRYGSLLIFDEVVTGFRLCHGGAQTLWNIRPDLTTLGKVVGGGFPMGAYGGSRKLMSMVAPLGPVYQAGTLSGNPVAVAAGLETLRILEKESPYDGMAALTRRLTDAVKLEAGKRSLPACINHIASMFTVFFTKGPVRDHASAKKADTRLYGKFFHALLKQGVYLPPAQFEACFVSAAHSEADIERAAAATAEALSALMP